MRIIIQISKRKGTRILYDKKADIKMSGKFFITYTHWLFIAYILDIFLREIVADLLSVLLSRFPSETKTGFCRLIIQNGLTHFEMFTSFT